MIINHSKKFIFFANRKTASTSVGIALSSSCSNKDVITPLGRDEKIRKELNYQGPANFIPWWNMHFYPAIEARYKFLKIKKTDSLKKVGLHTHISVTKALKMKYISQKIFENYFTFCFIRNPWDHAISQFYWLKRKPHHKALDLETFIYGGRLEGFAKRNRKIYSSNGKVLVDKLYKYEYLQEEVNTIFKDLDLSGDPTLPRAKSKIRSDRRHYKEILNTQQAETIGNIFSQEIEWGGYNY